MTTSGQEFGLKLSGILGIFEGVFKVTRAPADRNLFFLSMT